MEVLASRCILHPRDMVRSRYFYEQVLGLRIFHEYGTAARLSAWSTSWAAAFSNCPVPTQPGTGFRRCGSRYRT